MFCLCGDQNSAAAMLRSGAITKGTPQVGAAEHIPTDTLITSLGNDVYWPLTVCAGMESV